MNDWQAGDVEANGVTLHYTRTGGGKPPVVLAHGVTDSGLCWSPVAAELAADYDVIMVDARGHGHSEAPEDGYGPATQATDLAGLIGALGLNRPAVLGHSMGAATALVLAGAFPDVPGAILLEDPPSWWLGGPQPPYAEERRAKMLERFIDQRTKTRDELLAAQRAETPGWSDAELEPWADSKLRYSPNVARVLKTDNATSVGWAGVLGGITCPALLITADPERGAIVSPKSAEALRTLVPHLRVANVAAAGHSVRRDQFAPYLEVVRAFLGEWATARERDPERASSASTAAALS